MKIFSVFTHFKLKGILEFALLKISSEYSSSGPPPRHARHHLWFLPSIPVEGLQQPTLTQTARQKGLVEMAQKSWRLWTVPFLKSDLRTHSQKGWFPIQACQCPSISGTWATAVLLCYRELEEHQNNIRHARNWRDVNLIPLVPCSLADYNTQHIITFAVLNPQPLKGLYV